MKIRIMARWMMVTVFLLTMILPTFVSGSETKQTKIVTEIYPLYDWVMNIIGENPGELEVSLLIENGTDMHSYQPSVQDIMGISSCDMLVYIGGESDEWVDDAAAQAINEDIRIVKLMDHMNERALEEEELPGISGEPSLENESENSSDGTLALLTSSTNKDLQNRAENEVSTKIEFDEHIWLSLQNAALLCRDLAQEIAQLDPTNADTYRANAEHYIDQLLVLDQAYESVIYKAPVKTLLFADRFPFRYLVEDYGLSYYAAFEGCAAETEASFETIVFLADKVNELSLKHIMVIDGSDEKLAQTVKENTRDKNQDILILDSMQSLTENQIRNGTSYLEIMNANLLALKEALN